MQVGGTVHWMPELPGISSGGDGVIKLKKEKKREREKEEGESERENAPPLSFGVRSPFTDNPQFNSLLYLVLKRRKEQKNPILATWLMKDKAWTLTF